MKVLHVIPAVAPRYGGPSSSIVDMCRALADVGVEPLIATTDADGDGWLDVELGVPVDWKGTRAIFFRRQWSEAFKYSGSLSAWLSGQVADYSLVHIHAVLSHAPLAAAFAARRHGVPYVVRPLGTLDSWSLEQKAARKRLLLPVARPLLRGAAAMHYTSSEEMRQVEAAFGLSRGAVIPLGVQTAFLAEEALSDGDRAADRYVLAVSRLHPVKNLEALIDAFADLNAASARGTWRLIVAGSGDDDYARRLEARVDARRASGYVLLRGWTGGDEKRDLVRRASVFALPSLHENFGVGLVEAMAAGVPAVVGRGVHLAESIERSGAGWMAESSCDSIAGALRTAMTDTAARTRAGLAARAFASSFAWPTVARDLFSLYQRVSRVPSGSTESVRTVSSSSVGDR